MGVLLLILRWIGFMPLAGVAFLLGRGILLITFGAIKLRTAPG
jgi:hypothetical protein